MEIECNFIVPYCRLRYCFVKVFVELRIRELLCVMPLLKESLYPVAIQGKIYSLALALFLCESFIFCILVVGYIACPQYGTES